MISKTIYMLILLLVCSLSVSAFIVTETVTDKAQLLTHDQEDNLARKISKMTRNNTIEIAIITVETTHGQDRILFAAQIGDESGVGSSEHDDGIVILWSEENERGGAIATGRGIESVLNDAKVARIGRASKDHFDRSNHYAGFLYILDEIALIIPDSGKDSVLAGEDISSSAIIIAAIICVILVFLAIAYLSQFDSLGGSGGSGGSGSFFKGGKGGFGGFGGGGSFGGGGGRF